jgi:hypothetical protein
MHPLAAFIELMLGGETMTRQHSPFLNKFLDALTAWRGIRKVKAD